MSQRDRADGRATFGLTVEAWCWLALARLAIAAVRFERALGWWGLRPGAPPESQDAADPLSAAIGRAVERAARRTPWESACLPQALAGAAMLGRRRLPRAVYLGAAKNPDDTWRAHAWLRSGATILTGGAPGQELYTPVACFAPDDRGISQVGAESRL